MSNEREVEAALLIRADDPAPVAGQFADLRLIAGYHLHPRPTERLHDWYFDTPGRDLQTRRLPLRIRERDGARWIALKSARGARASGALEREEIELAWSPEGLGRILHELRRRGIVLPDPLREAGNDNPIRVMARLGLKIVQERTTERQARDVTATPPPAARLAELAIDRVEYVFPARTARLYLVEVEVKGKGGERAVEAIANALLEQFGAGLRRWPYGKLASGREIGELLAAGALDGLVGRDGALTPRALEMLEDRLRGA